MRTRSAFIGLGLLQHALRGIRFGVHRREQVELLLRRGLQERRTQLALGARLERGQPLEKSPALVVLVVVGEHDVRRSGAPPPPARPVYPWRG
jgi:hypothetical protein